MILNKKIYRAAENSYNSYEQYPLEKFVIHFDHLLQKYPYGYNVAIYHLKVLVCIKYVLCPYFKNFT